MKCHKCNNEVVEGANFCRYCGANLKDGTVEKTISDDEKYIKEYVGEKYDKFKNGTFNVGAFFLGPIYLLYRKMYLYTFIYILIAMFFSWIPIVPNLILGFFVNGMYLNKASEDVKNIKLNNSGLNNHEIIELCRKKGGTSIVPPLIYVLIVIVIISLLTALMFLLFYGIKDYDYQQNNYNNTEEKTYPKDDNELEFDYTGFERTSSNGYVSNNGNRYCTIYVYNYTKYDTSTEKEYFTRRANGNDLLTDDINGHTWYYYIEKKNYSSNKYIYTRYVYMALNGEKSYTIEA